MERAPINGTSDRPRSQHAPRPLFPCPYILQHQVARCTIPSHTTFFPSPQPWLRLVSHLPLVPPRGPTQLLHLKQTSIQVLVFSPITLKEPTALWPSRPNISPHLLLRSARVSLRGNRISSPCFALLSMPSTPSVPAWMNSTLGCMTLDPKSQIPSLVQRFRISVTPFPTCHRDVMWHPRFFDLHFHPQPRPHPLTPTQVGLAGLLVVPSLQQSPGTSLPKQPPRLQPVHMPMSSMVAPANLIRLLLRMLLPIGAKAKAKSLSESLLPLPPKSRPSLRPLYPRVLPLSPVPQGDLRP